MSHMNNPNNTSFDVIKIIQKKLLGKKLAYREIYQLMDEIAHERLSDILTTYFVAASFKEGYSMDELYLFTKAMVETGNRLKFKGIIADKHSTGGVSGTRTTMIIVPIVASLGFLIPKISSRAITTPAGTADTMELLAPVNFKSQEIEHIVETTGGCICWNGHLGIAPADDILIRVEEPISFESYDKIIISVMAKKIAVGSTHVVFDIPYGNTMKIRLKKDAQRVLERFVLLGKKFGMKVRGYVTHTIEPAGNGIGPALEVRDVLSVLEQQKNRPLQLEERSLDIAGNLLDLCFESKNIKKNGREEAEKVLKSKQALAKFHEIVRAQGGAPVPDSSKIHMIGTQKDIIAPKKGKILHINNKNLNTVAKILGAPHNKYAGIYLHAKTGVEVEKHEPILSFYAKSNYVIQEAVDTMKHFPILEFDS